LKAEQHPRVDLERQVQVDRALTSLFRVEVDFPVLAQRVALHEVALVVHVEAVFDGVILQIGDEPGDVDDGHEGSCASASSSDWTTLSPSARVRNARPRCDTRFFSAGAISANVRPSPSCGTNTGSYPKPPLPLLSAVITPSTAPVATTSRPSGQRTRATVTNLAARSEPCTPSSSWSSFATLSPYVASSPA